MPLEDWTVEILSIVPFENGKSNPYTGAPIDPEGLTQSLFRMRLTHTPTGKSLDRADLIGRPDAELFKNYARGVIESVEKNFIVQDAGLIGALDVSFLVAEDTRTQKEKDLATFNQAETAYQNELKLATTLKEADPAKADAIEAKLTEVRAARDLAAKPVIADKVDNASAALAEG